MSDPRRAALARGTLSRRLVLRVAALVAVVAVALSGLTVLSVREILESQLDGQLMSTSFRVLEPGGRDDDDGLRGVGGPGQAQGLLLYAGGTGFVQVNRDRQPLSDDALAMLGRLQDAAPTAAVTRYVPGLGSYRLLVSTDPVRGVTLVTGLPTAQLRDATLATVSAAALLTGVTLLAAVVVTREVVTRSLRPLTRLAATAHQVSTLELTSGDVAVPVRVAPGDTDPRDEVGQLGLAFNHMLDNVEGALAARQRSETKLRQFVADASHELRNPLAAIRGYAELTRRHRDELPPDTRQALVRIEAESARMSRLVEDLLLLARMDSGPQLLREWTDLCPLVLDAVADARAAGPQHRWSVDVPSDALPARVDAHRVQQAVVNLLANARTHTPPGTAVHTTLVREGNEAVIRVTDHGPGIPPAIRDTLFERFTRADTARTRSVGTSSTGLGLAIVQAVVRAHGGTVQVASEPGVVTSFTVRLPLGADAVPGTGGRRPDRGR